MDIEPAEEYELYDIEDLANPDSILNGGPDRAHSAAGEARLPSKRRRRRHGWLRRLFGRGSDDDGGGLPGEER